MNSYLQLLYNAVKEAILTRHPYDKELVGIIAEIFLDVNKEITIITKSCGGEVKK